MDEIKVVNVIPKDVHILIDFPVRQIKMLKLLIDHSEIEYDRVKEPEVAEAVDFLHEVLYPFLKKVDKEEFGEI